MRRSIFAVVCILFVFAAAPLGSPAPPAKAKSKVVVKTTTVTYVGCLRSEDRGQRFMLTDITGPNAPRARSWKTAFIMKRDVDVHVVPARGIRLREHVGKMVRITGPRDGREVHAQRLSYAGASCS